MYLNSVRALIISISVREKGAKWRKDGIGVVEDFFAFGSIYTSQGTPLNYSTCEAEKEGWWVRIQPTQEGLYETE